MRRPPSLQGGTSSEPNKGREVKGVTLSSLPGVRGTNPRGNLIRIEKKHLIIRRPRNGPLSKRDENYSNAVMEKKTQRKAIQFLLVFPGL